MSTITTMPGNTGATSSAEASPAPPPARDTRQRDLVPPARLARSQAVIVGAGAIGRQVALQLAAMGLPRLTLVDFDTVDIVNLGPQGYYPDDVGRFKVLATQDVCEAINPDVVFDGQCSRFRSSSPAGWSPQVDIAVFCAVDNIETRGRIWDAVAPKAKFFVDGRMSGETIRIVTAGNPAEDSYYKDTLFTAEEAFVGACTARSTIYAASIAAGLMISQFARWLRGGDLEKDLLLSLAACELVSMVPPPAAT